MTQEEREKISLETFLGREELSIGKITLRPLTLGTLAILKVVDNEFIVPRGVDGGIKNDVLAAIEYAFVHGAPLDRVRSVAFDGDAFRSAVLDFADSISPRELPVLIAQIKGSLESLGAIDFAIEGKPEHRRAEIGAPPN